MILSFFLIQQSKVTCLISVAKQAKTATQLGRQCEWSLFEPATASRSESGAQTTALQESTPNVTVGNAVSVLLHDKGNFKIPRSGLSFWREKSSPSPVMQVAQAAISFVNHSISSHGPGLAPFRTLTQFMQVIYRIGPRGHGLFFFFFFFVCEKVLFKSTKVRHCGE